MQAIQARFKSLRQIFLKTEVDTFIRLTLFVISLCTVMATYAFVSTQQNPLMIDFSHL